jgi:hypothetical protein
MASNGEMTFVHHGVNDFLKSTTDDNGDGKGQYIAAKQEGFKF